MSITDTEALELQRLEEYLLTPEVRSSPEELAAVLAEEFTEFGRSGRVHGRRSIIETIASPSKDELWLTEFSAQALADDVALVTYRSVRQEPGGEQSHSLRSSIWKRTNRGWKLVFHQGTPTDAQS